MDHILQDLNPATIGLSIDANKIAYGAHLSTFPEGTFYQNQDMCWFETGVPLDIFNGVLHTSLKREAISGIVNHIVNHFQQRDLPFFWRIGPSSRPTDFGKLLEASKIAHDEDEPGMALDLNLLNESIPVSKKINIQSVTTEELLVQWTSVWGCGAPESIIQAWQRVYSRINIGPEGPLRFYLGTLNGEPVATSALFFGAGVASIEHVVTIHRARGQGIGSAMTLAAAQEARKSGYRIAVLTASPLGINIYRQLGFQEYCMFRTYSWHPTKA